MLIFGTKIPDPFHGGSSVCLHCCFGEQECAAHGFWALEIKDKYCTKRNQIVASMRQPNETRGKCFRNSTHLCFVHRRGQQSNCLRSSQSRKHCSATKSPITAFDMASCRFGHNEQICHLLKEVTFVTPDISTIRSDLDLRKRCRASTKVSKSKLGQSNKRRVWSCGNN